MTPKLTIPVYPVWRLRENDIRMNTERDRRTLETCRVFLNRKSSDSAIGSQARNMISMSIRTKKSAHDPRGLSLPYNPAFLLSSEILGPSSLLEAAVADESRAAGVPRRTALRAISEALL